MSKANLVLRPAQAGIKLLPAFLFGARGVFALATVAFILLAASHSAVALGPTDATILPSALEASPATLRLSLQDCLKIAFEKNLGLSREKDSVLLAESSVTIERGKFRPILSTEYIGGIYNSHQIQDYTSQLDLALNVAHKAGGSVSLLGGVGWVDHTSDYARDQPGLFGGETAWYGPAYTSTLGIIIKQEFLKGAFTSTATAPLRQAEYDEALARLDLQALMLDLALSVKKAFFDLLKAKKRLEVIRSSFSAAALDVRIARQKLSEGLVSRLELLRAQLEWINRKRDLADARKQLRGAIDDLVLLLGLDVGLNIEPVGAPVHEPVAIQTEAWIDKALRVRPDIAALRIQISKAKLNEVTARNDRLPTLEAEAKFTMSETDNRFVETLDVTDRVWEFSLRFEHNLFDVAPGELLRQARIASRQLAKLLEDKKRDVAVAVRNVARELATLSEQLQSLKQAEAVAKEQLQIARLSYKEGLISNRDLIEAENDYTAARIDHINALFDYQSSLAKLQHTLGLLAWAKAND